MEIHLTMHTLAIKYSITKLMLFITEMSILAIFTTNNTRNNFQRALYNKNANKYQMKNGNCTNNKTYPYQNSQTSFNSYYKKKLEDRDNRRIYQLHNKLNK